MTGDILPMIYLHRKDSGISSPVPTGKTGNGRIAQLSVRQNYCHGKGTTPFGEEQDTIYHCQRWGYKVKRLRMNFSC